MAGRIGLHPRATYDFLDTLVALNFLERDGDGPDGRYRNTPDTAVFLDKNSPTYIGGILEMANARLYRFWGDLTEALQTGQPQNEIKHTGQAMFEELYSDPARLEQFMSAMAGISRGNFEALAAELRLLEVPDRLRRRWRDRRAQHGARHATIRTSRARATTCPSWRRSPSGRSPRPGSRTGCRWRPVTSSRTGCPART